MNRKKLWIGVVVAMIVIIAIIGIIAHSSKSNDMNMNMASSGSTAAVSTNAVTIKDYMFGPKVITVKRGTMVTWTNSDAVNHTITADTPSADAPSSMDIAQGKSYSFTFMKAGTYTYHCFPHPYMHGTVIVTN